MMAYKSIKRHSRHLHMCQLRYSILITFHLSLSVFVCEYYRMQENICRNIFAVCHGHFPWFHLNIKRLCERQYSLFYFIDMSQSHVSDASCVYIIHSFLDKNQFWMLLLDELLLDILDSTNNDIS